VALADRPDPADLATTQLLPYLALPRNEEAWRAFVARYRPRILGWCRRLQADDAEEVASRVLHKLVVGLARGAYRRRGPGTFRAWLRAVVGHEVVDLARQRRPAPCGAPAGGALGQQPDPLSLDELAGELDEQFRADCERAEQVCARVRGRVLPHTWEAFARTYLHGQEAREVARELGLTLSGVYKARDRVRQLLEAEGKADSPVSPVPTDDPAPLGRAGPPAAERRPAG
jgi:RNA polymerase sigma factor (sigma-70 family)